MGILGFVVVHLTYYLISCYKCTVYYKNGKYLRVILFTYLDIIIM